MQRIVKIVKLSLLALLIACLHHCKGREKNLVTYTQQFSGDVQLRDGKAHVDIRMWTIRGNVKLERLPMDVDGTMIAQLRGGELETTINGRREERREDEFWTVPRGVAMALATEDDSALLETIVVRDR